VCGGARVFLPPDARDFIYQFDNRQPVQPFSFDFEIPQEAIKP
jgi:hypothetical protein